MPLSTHGTRRVMLDTLAREREVDVGFDTATPQLISDFARGAL